MSGLNPLVKTCAIIVSSHRMPAETCSPWEPTSVKNADRNALRDGPAPPTTRLANSRPSRKRKPRAKAQGPPLAVWKPLLLREARAFVAGEGIFALVAQGEHDEGGEGSDRACGTIHQICQISAKPMMVAK